MLESAEEGRDGRERLVGLPRRRRSLRRCRGGVPLSVGDEESVRARGNARPERACDQQGRSDQHTDRGGGEGRHSLPALEAEGGGKGEKRHPGGRSQPRQKRQGEERPGEGPGRGTHRQRAGQRLPYEVLQRPHVAPDESCEKEAGRQDKPQSKTQHRLADRPALRGIGSGHQPGRLAKRERRGGRMGQRRQAHKGQARPQGPRIGVGRRLPQENRPVTLPRLLCGHGAQARIKRGQG